MNRSDFYYDQEVREQELDEVFDDVEEMEQNKIIDLDLWGVLTGLEVTEQAVPDLTVQVSAGLGHDRSGRKVVGLSIEDVDLSSHLPTTGAGYFRYVDIYGVDYMDESDPRLDGHSNPLNYRLTEGIDFLIVEGAENNGAPVPPVENTDHLPLSRVILEFGQTQIVDANISNGYRINSEIIWRRDRLAESDLSFVYTVGVDEYVITNPTGIYLATAASLGDTGFDASGRSVEDVGAMSMSAGGLGFNMSDNNLTNVGQIDMASGGGIINTDGGDINTGGGGLSTAGGSINVLDGNIVNVDQISMLAAGAGDPAIDMNDRAIGEVSSISFSAGSGSVIGLDMNDCLITEATSLALEAGTGTGIDTNGKDIVTDGGDLDLNGTPDGNIIGVTDITFSGALSSASGSISVGNSIHTDSNIWCDVDVFADYDGSGGGNFRYGVGGDKTQFLTLSANDADYEAATWAYNSQGTGGRPEIAASAGSTDNLVCFTVHLPRSSKIVSVKGKVYSPSASSVDMSLRQYNLQIDNSTTSPGNRTLVSGASVEVSIGVANYETLSDTLSSPHTVSEDYIYEVVFESNAAGVLVYGVEIEYTVDTVVAGLL